jgi:hypothetical protein
LPRQITEAKQHLADIEADITTRNANESDDFSMTEGNRVFSGKGARDEAAKPSHSQSFRGGTIKLCSRAELSGVSRY